MSHSTTPNQPRYPSKSPDPPPISAHPQPPPSGERTGAHEHTRTSRPHTRARSRSRNTSTGLPSWVNAGTSEHGPQRGSSSGCGCVHHAGHPARAAAAWPGGSGVVAVDKIRVLSMSGYRRAGDGSAETSGDSGTATPRRKPGTTPPPLIRRRSDASAHPGRRRGHPGTRRGTARHGRPGAGRGTERTRNRRPGRHTPTTRDGPPNPATRGGSDGRARRDTS